MLVNANLILEAASRYHKNAASPGRSPEWTAEIATDAETASPELKPKVRGVILGDQANEIKRKEMLEATAPEPPEFAFERTIGNNDSVYSNFIELLMHAKDKVGRIIIRSDGKKQGYATGFMVSERLLLTNNHVFETEEDALDSQVQFNYEYDRLGNPKNTITFRLDPGAFFRSVKELDYCLVAVAPTDIEGKVPIQQIGYLYLDRNLGKLGTEGKEALNIVHHPQGNYKQLSIRENVFTRIMDRTIWYESDTAQGSSGSPVFNDQWQVVALHHSGVPHQDSAGNFLDKDNQVIPMVNGKIDINKVHWIANEGIRISVILKDLDINARNHPLIAQMAIAPTEIAGATTPPQVESNRPATALPQNSSGNKIDISVPLEFFQATGQIHVHLSNQNPALNAPLYAGTGTSSNASELFLEKLKEERELQLDFSKAKGYRSNFLGVPIPFPQPNKSTKKFAAKINGSSEIILKYPNYSVIYHSLRKMPMISGINVEGDLKKRKDNTERVDDWLRDPRIPFDIQLNDRFYRGTGFDKGHMARREDANWGNTAAEAKTNADLTCMYTNACPQVPTLNRSNRKGLWGKLEMAILEKGAQAEAGRLAKISVFNGPVFKDDDPVLQGIPIPLDYWKIVLWLTDQKQLKATAFLLSQEGMVDDIDFDEAIDLDDNVEFAPYMVSIATLESLTGLDFHHLKTFDTYHPDVVADEKLSITDLDQVQEMVTSWNNADLA